MLICHTGTFQQGALSHTSVTLFDLFRWWTDIHGSPHNTAVHRCHATWRIWWELPLPLFMPHARYTSRSLSCCGRWTSDLSSHFMSESLISFSLQGFFCKTEADFEDLCQCIRKYILHGEKTPMFELHQQRPLHWPPFEPYAPEPLAKSGEFLTLLSILLLLRILLVRLLK